MTEIMCSFDVCLSVCLSVRLSLCLCVCARAQRTGQSDQFKTVKATDFKSDTRVSRDSPDMTPYKFFENEAAVKIHLEEICTLTSAF